MKRLLIAAIAVACLVASAEAGKRYILRVPSFEIPVELEEVLPLPPEPKPPAPSGPSLAVVNGVLIETRTGKPFRDLSTTIAGDACNQSDAMLETMFDRIEGTGSKLVRTLHVAIDETQLNKKLPEGQKLPTDGIDQYKPTLAEWRAGFAMLDRLRDQCKKRGMLLSITLHHRQRLTLEEAKANGVETLLYGKRFGGEYPGEIAELFLVVPELEKVVTANCLELATRYKDDPTVAMITIANEKARIVGRHISSRGVMEEPFKQYRQNYFAAMDRYQKEFGKTDATMRKADYARFHAWQIFNVYRRIYSALRAAGVKQPIAATNGLGDCRMCDLVALSAGDVIQWHSYGYLREDMPDPFEANEVRTIDSLARAIRIKGYPIALDEYSDVWEGNKDPLKRKLPGYLKAPHVVGAAGFTFSNHYCAFFGPIGFAKEYDSFDTLGFEAELKAARDQFLRALPREETWHQLTEEEVFGKRLQRIDPKTGLLTWFEDDPPIVGMEKYGTTGVILPDLPWLRK